MPHVSTVGDGMKRSRTVINKYTVIHEKKIARILNKTLRIVLKFDFENEWIMSNRMDIL